MNYALEDFSTMVRKLRFQGVNLYDKEFIRGILPRIQVIINSLEYECSTLYSLLPIMNSNVVFSVSMDALQDIALKKKEELDQWSEIYNSLITLTS